MSSQDPIESTWVSIITTNEIRYEGLLYNINQTEKTITLKDVRSFGTEDRRRENYIEPQNIVYGFIVYRSNEIKDLSVIN